MHPLGIADAEACIAEIARSAGITVSRVRQFPGGEQSAWEVVSSSGTLYVLKADPDPVKALRFEHAAATTAHLWNNAYPAPRYLTTGATATVSYALIEKLPGNSNRPVTRGLLNQLIALNKLQWGQAAEANPGWASEMVDSVIYGRSDYCIVDTLNNHSSQTRDLMRQIQVIADQSRELEVACADVVHFDFHPANVLSEADEVTGVIDWEGTCVGDASFDLATLLFYCYGDRAIRTTLTEVIMARSGASGFCLYLSHMILRQLDWSIRHHDGATVDHFMSRARSIVADLIRTE